MSDEFIVKVSKVNWQELEVRFADGRTIHITRTAKLAKRMEDRMSQFFYATIQDGAIRLGKFAPWQGSDFGSTAAA